MPIKVTPTLERYAYTHANIIVYVEIDYLKKKVSLIDKDGSKKKWLFAERGLEFLESWQHIMEAMNAATEHARLRLQSYEDKKSGDFALLAIELQKVRKN